METTPQLTNVLRLKSKLFEFREQGKVTADAYVALNNQLDRELKEAIADWPEVDLEALIKWAQENLPKLDISVYLQTLMQQRSTEIIKHHQKAKATNQKTLDVSHWHPDIETVEFNRFNWNRCIDELNSLIQKLKDPNTPFTENVVGCTRVFNRGNIPAGLPVPSARLISEMIEQKIITTYDASELIDDTLAVQEGLKQAQRSPGHPSNISKSAYTQLVSDLNAPESTNTHDLEKRLVKWQGPYHLNLLEIWLENRTSRPQELVAALIGIDPFREAAKWQDLLLKQKRENLAAELRLDDIVREESIVYAIANLLACAEFIPGGLQQLESRWKPVLAALTQSTEHPASEPILTVKTTALKTTTPKTTAPKATPSPQQTRQSQDEEDLFTLDEITFINEESKEFEYIEDEVDHFYAPRAKPTKQDTIVERESTWSLYLKPFLNENWLGLIGVSSLMVAWLFLSMWIWDKGAYYRIAAGAIPMLVITLGAGWITQFFQKLEKRGTSRKAVELFAALTLLSVPFNFLIDASLLESGGVIGFTLAAIALAVHLWIIAKLLGHWLSIPLGMNPRRYMIVANTLLLLPTLAILIAPEWLAHAVSLVLLLSFGVLVHTLSKLQRGSSRFPYIALGLQFIVAIATLHIYHAVPLSLMTAAVLIELIALSLITLFPTSATILVLVGSLTILGQAIGFIEPEILPVTLALALVCWFKIRRRQTASWLNDILVFHLFAFNASLAYAFDVAREWYPLLLLPALLLTIVFERKKCKARITTLSLGLPFYIVSLLLIAPADEGIRIGILSLVLLIGAYAYLRYSTQNLVGYWFTNLALMVVAPVALFYDTFFTAIELLANYISLLAVAWALLSTRLRDLFAHQHRTTVLWGLSFIATACVSYALYTTGYHTTLLLPASITLATLLIAAIRSASSLPVYLFLALLGYVGISIKSYYQISSSSGLSTVLVACALVVLARMLPALRWFRADERADRLFSSPFILQTANFIYTPFSQAALLLVLISVYKAALVYAPTSESWMLTLSMLIQTVLLYLGANQKRSAGLSLLMLIPATGLVCALILSLPYTYIPLAAVLSLLLACAAFEYFQLQEKEPPISVMKAYLNTLVWLSIPAGFVAYTVLINASPIVITIFSVAIVTLIHRYLYRQNANYAHLVFTHLWILWAFAYIYFGGIGLSAPPPLTSLLSWFIYGTAIMVAFVLLSSFRPQNLEGYRLAAKQWGWSLANIAAVGVILQFLDNHYFAWLPTIITFTLLLIVTEFSPQYKLSEYIPIILVASLSALIAHQLNHQMIWTLIVTPLVFIASQLPAYLFNNFLLGRSFKESIRNPNSFRHAPAYMLYFLVITVLVGHLALFAQAIESEPLPHAVLFLLIPYVMIVYHFLRRPHLYYLSILLFGYTNCFIALAFQPWIQQHALTNMHLISASLVFSLFCYTVLQKLVILRGARA